MGELFFFGLLVLLCAYALYALIRVAVCHGVMDAERRRSNSQQTATEHQL